MSVNSSRQKREERAETTKRAIAELMRTQIAHRKLRRTTIARNSGISRTHLRSLLRAEKQMSIFIFLELSEALRFDDPCQLLRDVLNRRNQLLAEGTLVINQVNATR